MVRWYAANRLVGRRPDSIVAEISTVVRQNDLGRVLPLIRIERKARGQFYLFLAIESDARGQLPDQLQRLHEYPIIKNLLRQSDGSAVQDFKLDQIQGMVTGEISVQDYARRLTRAILTAPTFAEPFPPDDPDAGLDAAEDDLLARSRQYDRLLIWLSAAGSGSLAVAQQACRALGLDADGQQTGRILRRLRLLGHIERSPNGKQWSIAPVVLTRVAGPAGGDLYLLCGGRDHAMLAALRRHTAVEETPQSRGDGPARVTIATEDVDRLAATLQGEEVVRQVRIDTVPVALRLATLLPPVKRWPETLEGMNGIKPEMYEVHRFQGDGFVEGVVSGSGFYELYQRDRRGSSATPDYRLFFDAGRDRWLAGDWYGLRFLARMIEGQSCPAHYELFNARLAIPEQFRLPELYERALVLCSGRLPERRGDWLWYDDVEPDLFTTLSAKLQLALQEVDSDA